MTNETSIHVIKRDGRTEPLVVEKFDKVCQWACEDTRGVSASELALSTYDKLYNNITTKEIHETLISTAADLITEKTPNYDKVASRLINYSLRKEVYDSFEVPPFLKIVEANIKRGVYTPEYLTWFSEEELEKISSFIDSNRDDSLCFAGMEQMRRKYLVQNRSSGEIFETPQIRYGAVAAALFANEEESKRLNLIRRYYNVISTHRISIPTPVCAGVGTQVKQFSSCTLIPVGDSLSSINGAAVSIVDYVSKKAGIGIDIGHVRGEGATVGRGEVKHTGVIPFIKYMKGALKSCSQGGVRGAAATVHYPWLHFELEDLLVLKNNQGTEENRERHMDYSVQWNDFFFDKLLVDPDREVTLFCPKDVPDLFDAFYAGDDEKFSELYDIYEKDPSVRKRSMGTAMNVLGAYLKEFQGTGRVYSQFMSACVNQGPFNKVNGKDYWLSSNLCVAPETQVLTAGGYIPIAELEDETIDVWNGSEWSETTVRKTGSNQKLIKVVTNSGQELECTPYHKFYIFDGYHRPCKEVRAHELQEGDKLAKFSLPVVQGDMVMDKPYVNGFYSGDGCNTAQGQRIYLYEQKRKLAHLFEGGGKWTVQDQYDRQYKHYNDLHDKYFVPTSDYTIKTRLEWLAGYTDADGCIYRNGDNQQLVVASVEREFLKQVQLMLQTLGVSAKIIKMTDEGMRELPANNGTGEFGYFHCKASWRLIVTSNDLYKLMEMGIKFNRLEVVSRLPQRDAKRFVKVDAIIDQGRYDDTFCFNEPKRHMGVFNGILTGQCQEISLPIKDFNLNDLDEEGMIALCTLSSVNWGVVNKVEDLEEPCRLSVRALDNLLSYQDYPVEQARRFTERFRALGIGIIGLAHFLAKRDLGYGIDAAATVDEYMEAMTYYLTDESVRIAEEKGPCGWYKETCYGDGIFPWERRNKNIDKIVAHNPKFDWEELRQRMIKYGIRNATLMAVAPTESSSQLTGETNGIEPPIEKVTTKTSKDGALKIVVPEVQKLKNKYTYRWDMESPKGYLMVMGVLQKWIDQSISVNMHFNPANYDDGNIPMSDLMGYFALARHLGLKNIYYSNTLDQSQGEDDEIELEQVELDDEVCDSCVP